MMQTPPGEAFAQAPFGDPDGSRESLEALLDHFVTFDESHGGLAMTDQSLRARVIVGRTGAGKTVYLRRLGAATDRKSRSVHAVTALDESVTTEAVMATCQWFRRAEVFEVWQRIWSRVICRTAVATILRTPALRDQLDEGTRAALGEFAGLIGRDRRPGTLYGHLAGILREHGTRRQLTAYLGDGGWTDLHQYLEDALSRLPPLVFLADGIDDAYSRAPNYWLPVQEGLFMAVMHWLRNPAVGGRLHVIVAIRDVVYSHVLRAATAGRYRGDPHIRILDWSGSSLSHLLRTKIGQLGPRHLARPEDEDPMRRWLGAARIRSGSGTGEAMADYLLRHCRLIPRDVVHLGNELCRAVLVARDTTGGPPPAATIRALVAKAARHFGDEQLIQCADQVTADMAPARSAQHGYAETYVGTEAYLREPVEEAIRECLRDLGTDRFDAQTLRAARESFGKRLDGSGDLATVLWQNGLLGFTGRRNGGDGSFFYRVGGMDDLQPPLEQREYLLHPCLIDAVGIRPAGRPITPHR